MSLQLPPKRHTVALVDDEVLLIESLRPLLDQEFKIVDFSKPLEALEYLSTHPAAVVLADYRMPKMNGIELLSKLKQSQPDTVGILFTAHAELDCLPQAINAAQVFHYIPKERLTAPDGFDEVSNLLRQAVELYAARTEVKALVRKLLSENELLDAQHQALRNQKPHSLDRRCFADLIGKSAAIQRVIDRAQLANKLRTDVHIYGETGTGKEILARALHYESDRSRHPFVAVNCGALPRDLICSEFFGHQKGAFTGATENKKGVFEQAHLGTLLLDEIGELPMDIQPALLRVLQEREVCPVGASRPLPFDARIISATHRDLISDVEAGRFRSDLLHRLNNGVAIELPPLRERGEDVRLLAEHFFSGFQRQYGGSSIQGISAEGLAALERYPFPGNVRQLSNVIKEAVFEAILDGRSSPIDSSHLKLPGPKAFPIVGSQGRSLQEQKDTLTRDAIEGSLRENSWNITRAAAHLNLSREWLSKLMKQHGIVKPQGAQ